MSLYLGTTPIANDGSHNTANIDLSNLSNTGEAHFANPALTNSPYTTNRILEIPQDIKLELNNGILTLKAGSKVYKLDGTSITTTSDSTLSTSYYGFNQQSLIYYSPDSNSLEHPNKYICFSGNGYPTITEYQYMLYFDVTNKKYYWTDNNGSSWTERTSATYPIAIATVGDSNWTSIDQIFNGFGYIGSTVFALPGVKVQIPNGRNEDGTYRVIPYTTQNVITREVTGTGVKDITLQPNGILNQATGGLYLAEDGYHRGYIDSSTKNIAVVLARVLITTAGKIDNFVPRNVDSVANSNASNFSQAGRSYLSGLGMPSNRYIDLTLGASGSTYTAPANGWFCMGRQAGADNAFIDVYNSTKGFRKQENIPLSSVYGFCFVPCSKNDVIVVNYNASGTLAYFRFIYAEGDK